MIVAKFKCKKCNKMITIIPDTKEQQCIYCDTIYENVYDKGWGYDIKGYRTKKCVYCKNKMFVPVPDSEGVVYNKMQCEQCKRNNIAYWFYESCEMIPCDTFFASCAWCEEKVEMDVSTTTEKWIITNECQYQENRLICPKCKREFSAFFGVSTGHPTLVTYTERIYKQGRKKKATKSMLKDFLDNNSIYQQYTIVHPFNVYEYCEQNHINEDLFFDLLENEDIEIFDSLGLKEIEISKYEDMFSGLILKENAMTDAGGASLSGVLGGNKAWKDLRKMLLEKEDYTCEICGYKAAKDKMKTLHVHEEWVQERNIVTLKKVSLICSRCHACSHVNQFVIYRVLDGQDELVEGIPRIDLITIHLMHVNKVSKEVIYAYRKQLHEYWKIVELEKSKKSDSVQEDTQYWYQIDETIPNRIEIIKALQRKGLYFEE